MSPYPQSTRGLRLPPFANDIPARRRTIWISAGPRAWARARRWQREEEPGLVAPPGVDPARFDWSVVHGYRVALIACDLTTPELVRLIYHLAQGEPSVIAVLHGPETNPQTEILVPGRDV